MGPVMIGAKNDADALNEAGRSIEGTPTIDNLEVYRGDGYVPVRKPSNPIGTAKDPLRKKGDWQDADLVALNADGTETEVNAKVAVSSLMKRHARAKRLLECVNA